MNNDKDNLDGDLIDKGKDSIFTGRTFVMVVVIISLIVMVLRLFVLFPVKVEGNSMNNTLISGERYLVNKVATPEIGDIVVFKTEEGSLFIKRVIGKAGDTVEIRKDYVYVNEEKLKEDYIKDHRGSLDIGEKLMEDMERVTLKKGTYFVLGDNRLNSVDSRELGLIKEEDILGVMIKFR